MRARPNASGGIWRPGGSSTTPCSRKDNDDCDVCGTIRPGKRRERSLVPASKSALREQYGFSEYALHAYAKTVRQAWIADHLDAVLAQTLATRAYDALNRVCLGEARRVRFKSRGRGLSSIENKRNDTGLRFVLHKPAEGNQG